MSSVGSKGVIIQDALGGDAVTVTDGKLDVNAVLVSDDIDIGNVVLQNDAGADIFSAGANADMQPDLDNQLLLGTHALLSARSNVDTTIGITCEDSTHNALHVAISDGAGIANVDGNNALLVDVVAGGVLESAVPALGTAGSASANVITVQGIASMTPLIVDLGSNNDVTGTFFPANSVSLHDASNRGYVGLVDASSGATIYSAAANSAAAPDLDGATLLGTHALLSARTDGTTTVGLTAETSAHNALHVAISDGLGIALVNASGELEVSTNHSITGAESSKNTAVGTSIEDLSASNVACKRVDMMANPDNTGYIWVGGTNTAVGQGIRLAPGDFYSIDIDNTEDIQVIATVNAEDISFVIYT